MRAVHMSGMWSLAVFLALASISTSWAATLYDEGVSGDLPNLQASALDLGSLQIGSNTLTGTITGAIAGPDTDDWFTFDLAANRILSRVTVLLYTDASGTPLTGSGAANASALQIFDSSNTNLTGT